ncbi:T9SS type A sorting domain-containing protein [Psychroflexus torquis]|uniref:T9SS type A sorting domain-containing protein n=1 Tax=Psychroflexus torquis TaxID=57029 RepID=UPI0000D52BB1|nr:T9SS type A sorting domain-containing protein [Psychroflexus torquis]
MDTAFIISDKATSETLGIENVSNNLSFSVYPNPSNDKKINLNYDTSKLNSDEHNVVIFSTVGKKILQTTLNKVGGFYNKSLDLSSLAGGIYILQFTSGGFTTTKRIILK